MNRKTIGQLGQHFSNEIRQGDDKFTLALNKQILAAQKIDQMESISGKDFQKAMQKLKERGNSAVPPKKSASAYIIFGKEKRAEILKRNPLAKVTEVVKEIAQTWRKLTKQDRQKYKEQAKRDRERYDKELKSLELLSEKVKKPKKCLSAYMIFVKETRPKIVEDHSEMSALQVMQEVGKQWQSLEKEDRKYFKEKADVDKVRYIKEQRSFYDEVGKIGNKVGTCMNNNGQIVVATNAAYQSTKQHKDKQYLMQQSSTSNQILQKRGSNQANIPAHNESPSKRMKLSNEEKKGPLHSNKNQIQMIQSQSSVNNENKPKKPLSAYIYFSQEFREIIRQRFPFLTVAQMMKAVSFRWQGLSKEEKQPFETIANEDKARYDKDLIDYKKGLFQGRSQQLLIKLTTDQDNISSALQISDDLLEFLQVVKTSSQSNNNNNAGDSNQQNEVDQSAQDEYNDDEDFDQDEENKHEEEVEQIYASLRQNNNQSNSFKVVLEKVDEKNLKRSNSSSHAQQDQFSNIPLIQVHAQDQSLYSTHATMNSDFQKFQVPYGYEDQMNALIQSEMIKREYERKYGLNYVHNGFYPNTGLQQYASPMIQFQLGPNGLVIDDGMTYYANNGAPFQLPPSNNALDQNTLQSAQQQNFLMPQSYQLSSQQQPPTSSSASGQQQQFSGIPSSPQLTAQSQILNNQQLFNNFIPSQQQQNQVDFQSGYSPFLAPQAPQQQFMFQPFQQQYGGFGAQNGLGSGFR